jgi:hypothetical protein
MEDFLQSAHNLDVQVQSGSITYLAIVASLNLCLLIPVSLLSCLSLTKNLDSFVE